MNFEHKQFAHCESGVVSSILTHSGLVISEPMAFGLSNSLAFAFVPLVKLGGQPLVSYRLPPKSVIKGLSKRLGIDFRFEKFSSPIQGADELARRIDEGRLIGLQSSVFFLPYFPEEMRFHFNAHNLLVYGRDDTTFHVSDPVLEEAVEVSEKDLTKARFARGPLAPKGLMYWAESVPDSIDYEKVIPSAIKRNNHIMTGAPLPIIGIRGIRFLAKKIRKLPKKKSPKDQILFLGNIVRMQEEIGTGGAGFRFMYASFLNEASNLLDSDELKQASEAMTDVGDSWREFALYTAQACKSKTDIDAERLANQLEVCATQEHDVWRSLSAWVKSTKS